MVCSLGLMNVGFSGLPGIVRFCLVWGSRLMECIHIVRGVGLLRDRRRL